MTTGTKVFLAVFALIVGILVVYYGMIVPAKSPNGVRETGTSQDQRNSPKPADQAQRPASGATPERPAVEATINDAAPPPRVPTPLARVPMTQRGQGEQRSGSGGLLSQGVQEAGGETNVSEPRSAFLPLVGLNNPGRREVESSDSASDARASEPVSQPESLTGEQAPLEGQPATQPVSADAPAQPVAPSPPASDASPAPAAPTSRVEFVIAEGDTFVSIAEAWFGDSSKWSLIARENPTVDPQRLKIGQVIFLPPRSAGVTPVAPEPVVENGESVYVIQSGDTLIAIARDQLGDATRWEAVYEMNKAVIGPDAAALKVGMRIKLPRK